MLPLLLALSLSPLPVTPAPEASEESVSIPWFEGSYDEALARAAAEHKPVVLYFWMDPSESCAQLYGGTLQHPAVGRALAEAICFSVPHADSLRYPLFERYQVSTVPSLVVLRPDGQADDGMTGVAGPDYFLSELQRMYARRNTVSDLETRLAAVKPTSPEGLELAWRLADRLSLLGAEERAAELLAFVRKSDPKGKTRAGAELLLADAQEAAWSKVEKDEDLPDMTVVLELARKSRVSQVRHKAWTWLAGVQRSYGDSTSCMQSLQAAWKDVPAEELCDWGAGTVAANLDAATDELSSKDRKFLLEVAREVVEHSEALDPEGTWWRQTHPLLPFDSYVAARYELLAKAWTANGKESEAERAMDRAHELNPELAVASAKGD